jgi:hypothetical protein
MLRKRLALLALSVFIACQAKADIIGSLTLGPGTTLAGTTSIPFVVLSAGPLTFTADFAPAPLDCQPIDPTMPYKCGGSIFEYFQVTGSGDIALTDSNDYTFPNGSNDFVGYEIDGCNGASYFSGSPTCTTSEPAGNYVLTLTAENDFIVGTVGSSVGSFGFNSIAYPFTETMSATVSGDVAFAPEPNVAPMSALLLAAMLAYRFWVGCSSKRSS